MSLYFPSELRKQSIVYTANTLESAILWNESGQLQRSALPMEAQVSPVFGITVEDFTGDGKPDIWVGGNFYGVKPQSGRYDASRGLLLQGNNSRSFDVISPPKAGPYLEGEVRDATLISTSSESVLLIARNNRELVIWEW